MIIPESPPNKPVLGSYAPVSSEPPPSFEDAVGSSSVPVANPNLSEDQPPPFAPYVPESSSTGRERCTVSHDPHLNQDGEALFRFLVAQSQIPPDFYVHIHGKHEERRSRSVWRKGKLEQEDYTEIIVDFDFRMDLGQFLLSSTLHGGPVYYSVADDEPCYRGSMVREVFLPNGGTRKPNFKETRQFKRWLQDNQMRGLPPWAGWRASTEAAGPDLGFDGPLRGSRTIRDWADEYCASDKLLKEFIFDKKVCGWNLGQLESVIRDSIRRTLYQGHLDVHFETRQARVYVRPDNSTSRLLTNIWLKVLMWILLIYPFVWLFKRFHRRGGGKWHVAGACYFMKRWVTVPTWDPEYHNFVNNKGLAVGSYDSSRRLVRTPDGVQKLVGMRESEWLRDWEPTIIRAVNQRYISHEAISLPVDTLTFRG